MCSCSTRKHVVLSNKTTCFLVEQEHMSSCSTRRHVFLFNRKTCLLVQQEEMSSCSTRRNVFLLNKKTCLFNKKTCLLVQQEHIFSCRTKPYTLTEIMEKNMIQMTTKASMKIHLNILVEWESLLLSRPIRFKGNHQHTNMGSSGHHNL